MMQYNKKNILFKILAKYIRYLKELRSSYDHNIHDEDALTLSIAKNLDLVTGIGIVGAQNFVEGRNVNIRELYPLKFTIRGTLKYKMQLAFIDFLREKGAYESYLNYRAYPYTRTMKLHEQVMRWVELCGFSWSLTPEGTEFWSAISCEWKDFCLVTTILDE